MNSTDLPTAPRLKPMTTQDALKLMGISFKDFLALEPLDSEYCDIQVVGAEA